MTGAHSLATGDVDGDGIHEVLVGTRNGKLQRLTPAGVPQTALDWPADLDRIEVGRHRQKGPRLLGYSNWGKQVRVFSASGGELWSFASKSGVNGAHWGDLDGDGTDEMVVGQNGAGGLQAISSDGNTLWSETNIGNVWNQAVIPATPRQASLIFATEAGGFVRVYDAAGQPDSEFRLDGKYCAPMTAARMDAAGNIQVIGEAGRAAVAVSDGKGRVAWSTPVAGAPGHWRQQRFASGDLDGDQVQEWIFEEFDHLVVASPKGEKRASIPISGDCDGFAVLHQEGKSQLVLRRGVRLSAYGFTAQAVPSPTAQQAVQLD